MHIVHITPDLEVGGLQNVVINLANESCKEKKITIICLGCRNNDREALLNDNIQIINLNSQITNKDTLLFLKVFKCLNKIRPDVVHTHGISMLYAFIYTLLIRTKLVHTIHNLVYNEAGIIRGIIWNFFFRFKHVFPITISPAVDESFKKRYKNRKSILIPNGIPKCTKTQKFYEVRDEISKLKKNNKDIVFINVGRVDYQKNQRLLVDTFLDFKKHIPEAILLIIGDKSQFHLFFEEAEKDLIEYGIYFLGTKNNVSDYLFNSDIFCLSSNFEGHPLTLIEAMSVGLLSACTPAGGIKNMKLNDVVLVSDEINSKSYSDVIFEAAKKYDKNKLMRVEAFESYYHVDICCQRYNQVYEG